MRFNISYTAHLENHIKFHELGYFQLFVKYDDLVFVEPILLQKVSDGSYLILNKVGNIKIDKNEDIVPVEVFQ
jgi:hypothetical protein